MGDCMSLFVSYGILICLFWFIWLTYMPRYSFVNYLRNKEIENLKFGWDIYQVESIYKSYSYYFLIHKSLDEVIIFDYDKSQDIISIKDQRMKSYQENKQLIDLISKYYKKEELNSISMISEKEYKELKQKYKKSYYYINGYDFHNQTKINII